MLRKGKKLSNGQYGEIYEAFDKINSRNLVVKRNLVYIDDSFFVSLRELDFLYKCGDHPFIVNLLGISFENPFDKELNIIRKNGVKEDKLFFIFEKADGTLYDLNLNIGEDYASIKKYMIQLLIAIEYLHSNGIIHRDLKPDNILWFKEGYIKICDFGMSKVESRNGPHTPRTISTWYRPPEIIYERSYDTKADIWSTGLIMAEMITHKALIVSTETNCSDKIFDCNDTDMNIRKVQLETMISMKDIDKFNESPGTYEEFIDLLKKMIHVDKVKRITATEALNHPFFKGYKNSIDSIRNKYPPNDRFSNTNQFNREFYGGYLEEFVDICMNKDIDIRVIFHTIEILDRYLFNQPEKTMVEYLEIFLVSLDISMKLIILYHRPSHSKILKLFKYDLPDHKFYEIEKDIIRKLNYILYRDTLYEISSSRNIINMLKIYSQIDTFDGISINDVYKSYREIMNY